MLRTERRKGPVALFRFVFRAFAVIPSAESTVLDHLHRLFDHMYWADARVLERLRSAPEPAAVRLLAHVLGAEEVWLTRLHGKDSRHLKVWPSFDVAGCEDASRATREGFQRYLAELDERSLPDIVEYTNQQGEPFHTPRIDILTHVVTHGVYHRGQIAQTLRLAGHEPVITDFIVWSRTGDR